MTRTGATVIVALACLTAAVVYAEGGELPYRGLLVVFPTFIGGVGLGKLYPPCSTWSQFSRFADLGVLAMVLLPYVVGPGGLQSALYIFFSFALVGILGRAGNRCGAWLRSHPLSYLGEISYSLYMTHAITITLMTRFLPLSTLNGEPLVLRCAAILGCLMLIFGASLAIYYTVERPMRTWSRLVVSH